MVAGEAAEDATARARRLPNLGVGLHLVLVDGRPMLPARQVPDLVDEQGLFRTNMVRAGVSFFFRAAVRRQLAAEIEAQFAAFATTGLPLDHVNAHKHFHLHPTILSLMLETGARYGIRAARAPVEPKATLVAVEPVARPLSAWVADPWARHARRRLAAAGLAVPDQVFGLAWSGQMNAGRLAGLIDRLRPGLTEIYLHPATEDRVQGYAARSELAALTDPETKRAVANSGARLGRFMDFDAGLAA
jgi:chitin disaccharide deacetylase